MLKPIQLIVIQFIIHGMKKSRLNRLYSFSIWKIILENHKTKHFNTLFVLIELTKEFSIDFEHLTNRLRWYMKYLSGENYLKKKNLLEHDLLTWLTLLSSGLKMFRSYKSQNSAIEWGAISSLLKGLKKNWLYHRIIHIVKTFEKM